MVSTISANSDVWKPTSDYFVDCSHTAGKFIVKLYAHYDLDKDKKFVTDFTIEDGDDDYFSYDNIIAIREYSSDTTHRFYLDKLNYWRSTSGGEMKNDYFGRDKKVRIYRENLVMNVNGTKGKCRIMSGEEYRITINNLEKERDVLVQDFIEKRKSQLNL